MEAWWATFKNDTYMCLYDLIMALQHAYHGFELGPISARYQIDI